MENLSAALLREDMERFFASYRDAFNSGDPAAVAQHIAAPCLLIEREMTVWSTADEVLEAMTRLLTFYRESGANELISSWNGCCRRATRTSSPTSRGRSTDPTAVRAGISARATT